MSKPILFVPLMGGLGNQLFQLAAALYAGERADIALDSQIYAPRAQRNGIPDIAGFRLPSNVRLLQASRTSAPSKFTSRAGRRMIEQASSKNAGAVSELTRLVSRASTSVLLWRHLRTFASLRPSTETGYDPGLRAPNRDAILTGFFQTWRYLAEPRVAAALHALEPSLALGWLEEMRSLAAVEAPTVVHVRLADYRSHADFGIPGANYYRNAMSRLEESTGESRIWVFSDEPDAASDFLPDEILNLNPRFVVPPDDADPACTLAVMSLGHQFILANSSFGYWAAVLADVPSSRVTIPEPWFVGLPAFTDFAPEGWQRIGRSGTA